MQKSNSGIQQARLREVGRLSRLSGGLEKTMRRATP
jgi:hypothetical protein